MDACRSPRVRAQAQGKNLQERDAEAAHTHLALLGLDLQGLQVSD